MNAEQEMKLLRLIQGVRDDVARMADHVNKIRLGDAERLRVATLIEAHMRGLLEIEESKR